MHSWNMLLDNELRHTPPERSLTRQLLSVGVRVYNRQGSGRRRSRIRSSRGALDDLVCFCGFASIGSLRSHRAGLSGRIV